MCLQEAASSPLLACCLENQFAYLLEFRNWFLFPSFSSDFSPHKTIWLFALFISESTGQSFMFLRTMLTLWIWMAIFNSILVSRVDLINCAGGRVWLDIIHVLATNSSSPNAIFSIFLSVISHFASNRWWIFLLFIPQINRSCQSCNVFLAYTILSCMLQLLCLPFDVGHEIYNAPLSHLAELPMSSYLSLQFK